MVCLTNYTVQCVDVTSGKTGCFFFDGPYWQFTGKFRATSPVFPDLEAFYAWDNQNGKNAAGKFLERVVPSVVSVGTLRTQDLLRSFSAALCRLKPGPESDALAAEAETVATRIDADWEDANAAESGSWILDDLDDALNGVAPAGFYFGADEGDGACFGFWECE